MTHLAQFNIGRLAHDLDDPRVADFVAGADLVNRIAGRAEGFVWKYETGRGGVVLDEALHDDPRIVVNMTLWESVETLRNFIWKTLHKHFVNRRAEWFEPMEQAHSVMWWVPAGHRPDLIEARDRLETYRREGASGRVFDWPDLVEARSARGQMPSGGEPAGTLVS